MGSVSWDSSLPRMVTWVRLQDLKSPTAKPIVFYNTHFDHRGTTARLESARLIRQRLESLVEDASVVITGDFNAGDESEPYQALFAAADDRPSPVGDSFRMANPQRTGEEGTFSGFRADSVGGPRIDWIGVSRDWTVRSAEIDRTSRAGRTPSDHFPVTAVLRRNE